MNASEEKGRRTFLGWVSGGIAAAMGLVVGIPLVGYTILPALKRRQPEWNDVGNVEALQPGVPKEMACIHSITDGWQKTTTKKSIWVVRNDTGTITAYSPICTHLGCGYRWEADQRKFHCPCHHSFFSLDGKVLSGPAPRPLDTLPAKIEKGRLLVIYKEFKAGTAAKIEL
ncbi:MAG: ubiquinol-cytochrome c reductase iron-sulfur subunit [Nitrospira sp.]|nr:ubiquinol-cytochrome c reductase iron-sulfur subunit [Nitrospira sp.]